MQTTCIKTCLVGLIFPLFNKSMFKSTINNLINFKYLNIVFHHKNPNNIITTHLILACAFYVYRIQCLQNMHLLKETKRNNFLRPS